MMAKKELLRSVPSAIASKKSGIPWDKLSQNVKDLKNEKCKALKQIMYYTKKRNMFNVFWIGKISNKMSNYKKKFTDSMSLCNQNTYYTLLNLDKWC